LGPRLIVTPREHWYALYTVKDDVVLFLPRGNLVESKETEADVGHGNAYFYFSDPAAQGLIVSGWFEPASRFQGLEEYWRETLDAQTKNGLAQPSDVAFTTVGEAQVIQYERSMEGLTASNVVAEWVKSNTWIDLHASIASSDPPEQRQAQLLSFLREIQIKVTR
jgi:hypothetical protein